MYRLIQRRINEISAMQYLHDYTSYSNTRRFISPLGKRRVKSLLKSLNAVNAVKLFITCVIYYIFQALCVVKQSESYHQLKHMSSSILLFIEYCDWFIQFECLTVLDAVFNLC